jgi:hypothetical protein
MSVKGQGARFKTTGVILAGFLAAALICSGNRARAEGMSPLEKVASVPKGQLKSPYPDYSNVAEEGRRIYFSLDCNGLSWRWWRWRNGRTAHQSSLDLRQRR